MNTTVTQVSWHEAVELFLQLGFRRPHQWDAAKMQLHLDSLQPLLRMAKVARRVEQNAALQHAVQAVLEAQRRGHKVVAV